MQSSRVPISEPQAEIEAFDLIPSARISRLAFFGHLISLIRPRQWVKNGIVFLPFLFTPAAISIKNTERMTWALLAFILASSLTYIVNDVVDRERDRAHPEKISRPIAAGLIGVPCALSFAALIAGLLGVVIATQSPARAWWPIIVYLGVNAAYNSLLKHIPPFDVFIVAIGFTLRVAQGDITADIPYSALLLLCVFALCLQLSLGKRRYEILKVGARHRPALAKYTVQWLDHMLLITGTIALVSFMLYIRFDVHDVSSRIMLLISTPCALLATFRYQQILLVEQGGGDPVRTLMHDRIIVAGAAAVGSILFGAFLVGNLWTR
jgi:decaprenyl-phosphate phosphoribosyltransferase